VFPSEFCRIRVFSFLGNVPTRGRCQKTCCRWKSTKLHQSYKLYGKTNYKSV
jgi:hypothetical protein